MCNFKSSRKFGRSSLSKCKFCPISRFFLQCPRTMTNFPEKFPSLTIPGKISKFPDEFCFSPETGLDRVVTPRNTRHETSRSIHGRLPQWAFAPFCFGPPSFVLSLPRWSSWRCFVACGCRFWKTRLLCVAFCYFLTACGPRWSVHGLVYVHWFIVVRNETTVNLHNKLKYRRNVLPLNCGCVPLCVGKG